MSPLMIGALAPSVNGVHITDPHVDKMVKRGVIERHVVGATIKLVLVECHQASMKDQVVQRQPLFQNVTEVLFQVLRPKQSRIDEL